MDPLGESPVTSLDITAQGVDSKSIPKIVDAIINKPSDADLDLLIEIGDKGSIGYEWAIITEGLQKGYILSECALQRLFELTHIYNITEIQQSEEDRNKVERILQQKIPLAGFHIRENLDSLMNHEKYKCAMDFDAERAQKLFSHYSSWRHAINQGPLSVGLRTFWKLIEGLSSVFGSEQDIKTIAQLHQINSSLLPAEFGDGSRVDWTIWEPDFSICYPDGSTWGLQEIDNPDKKARLLQDTWKFQLI